MPLQTVIHPEPNKGVPDKTTVIDNSRITIDCVILSRFGVTH